jgi:hypothetical protein
LKIEGIKRQFGLMKVRFRGLVKNTAHVVTPFALSNLWMARRQLMALAEVRPQRARSPSKASPMRRRVATPAFANASPLFKRRNAHATSARSDGQPAAPVYLTGTIVVGYDLEFKMGWRVLTTSGAAA